MTTIRTIGRQLWDGWMRIVDMFSWVATRVMLVILFFTMFLFYGLALRILKRDPLDRGIDTDRSTYWTDYIVTTDSLDEFKKQY